jgi:chaperonin cofactor prefoldin
MNISILSMRKILLAMSVVGLFLLAGLSLVPDAASSIWMIRWYPLHICSMAFICLGGCGLLIDQREDAHNSHKNLLILLICISIGLTAGALTGPFPGRALIYSLSTIASIFCGCIFLVKVQKEHLIRLFTSRTFQILIASFVCIWSGISLYRYFTQQLLPFLANLELLDQAANGGLYDLIFQKHFSTLALRNGSPFGHPNYNSGFLLILLPLLYYGLMTPASKGVRGFSLLALLLGALVLITTQSRNALLGLGTGIAIAVWWNQLQPKRSLQIMAGLAILGLAVILVFPRFQQMLTSVSPARKGMWQAAWMTGLKYFPFGSGEGLTPEMLQLFSPEISSIWENAIQFHHTWLHLWAVGGVFAGVGILGITVWILIRMVFPGELDLKSRQFVTPSIVALSASFIVFWADYQLDIFPIALLLYFHLVVLAVCTGRETTKQKQVQNVSGILCSVPGICLLICVWMLPSSLKSRTQIEAAGTAYEQGDIPTALSKYLQAFETVPEPYSLNMAAVLLSENPAGRQDALDLFQQSLTLWEPQTLVHEYLVDLWIKEAESATEPFERKQALEYARHHAIRRTQIAPQLRGSFLDVAKISHELELSDSDITEALLFELLMQGDLLFPETWTVLGELQPYREEVLKKLMTLQSQEDKSLQYRIETMQGYLYLIDEIPPGFALSDNLQKRMDTRLENNISLRLLSKVCHAMDAEKAEAMKRLLVYLFEAPVSDQTVAVFMASSSTSCMTDLLCFGQPRLQPTLFQGVGLSARHPFSVPVNRPRAYPDVLGSKFVPINSHKSFSISSLTNLESH